MSAKMLFIIFVTQVCSILTLPQSPTKCKPSDKACLLKSAQSLVTTIANGIPELGMDSLDPMRIEKIVIDLAGLKLTTKNSETTGLKKSIVVKVEMDMEKKQLVLGYVSDLYFKAKYKASGRLIVLPISGDGDCTIKLKQLYVEFIMPFELKKKDDGKTYMKLKGMTFNFDIRENARYELTNLFGGNERLSVPLLKFMNENWKLVSQEFGRAIMEKPHNVIYLSIKKYLASQPIENFIME